MHFLHSFNYDISWIFSADNIVWATDMFQIFVRTKTQRLVPIPINRFRSDCDMQ